MDTKNMKTSIIGLSFIAFQLPIYSSAEQDTPISLGEIQTREIERFEKLDLNKDGHVSLIEFEKNKQPINRKHKNMRRKGHPNEHRGRIGKPPFAGRDKRKGNMETIRKNAHSKELFSILDEDHNQALSEQEFLGSSNPENHHLAQQRAAFSFFDSNKDGQLSRNELPSRAKRLETLDSNQDGFISKEEMTNRVPKKQ